MDLIIQNLPNQNNPGRQRPELEARHWIGDFLFFLKATKEKGWNEP